MASLQARHVRTCPLYPWSTFANATKEKGCTCRPLYYVTGGASASREAVGHDRKRAEREHRKIAVAIDEDTYIAPINKRADEWLDEWHAALRRPNENTKRSYRAMLTYGKEAFGTKPLRKVTTSDVAHFLRLHEGRSPTTQRRHLRELHACFETAIAHDPPYMASNPIKAMRDEQKPREQRRKASPFEPTEIVKLWPKLPEPYRTVCKLSYATGMRQGEIIGLTWGAVDLDAGLIYVRRVYTAGIGFVEATKSEDSDREVILGEKAAELLREWKRQAPTLPAKTALVFPGPGRDGQLINSSILRALYKAMLAAGVPREWKPGHKWRDFHSMRHSFVSAMIGNGLSLEWISQQLGHSSIAVTERHYLHFLTAARRELAGDRLDAALNL